MVDLYFDLNLELILTRTPSPEFHLILNRVLSFYLSVCLSVCRKHVISFVFVIIFLLVVSLLEIPVNVRIEHFLFFFLVYCFSILRVIHISSETIIILNIRIWSVWLNLTILCFGPNIWSLECSHCKESGYLFSPQS